MPTLTEYLSAQHQHCDSLFATAETAAIKHDLAAARAGFAAFLKGIMHHIDEEEKILFPAFEQATGSNMGPTHVMRLEHEQMRGLFAQMQDALDAGNTQTYAGLTETLLVLLQQHNFKEEQILYPMSDRALQDHDGLISQMKAL